MFPQALDEAYNDLDGCHKCDSRLSPWKFSGDEILFTTVLKDHREVATHLEAFRTLLRSYPHEWAKKKIPLGLKGTAWLAGFPITNRELEIPGAAAPDYIGPSIDLGFRISKFASQRRLVLSADLALMLLNAAVKLGQEDQFDVFLLRRESLKGVVGGKPYPIVWLDVGDQDEEREERLLGIHRKFVLQDMTKFLRDFIDSASGYLIHPFMESDEAYATIPSELEELRQKMKSEESFRGYKDGGEDDHPPTGACTEPKPPGRAAT